jgi:hypothetical protein
MFASVVSPSYNKFRLATSSFHPRAFKCIVGHRSHNNIMILFFLLSEVAGQFKAVPTLIYVHSAHSRSKFGEFLSCSMDKTNKSPVYRWVFSPFRSSFDFLHVPSNSKRNEKKNAKVYIPHHILVLKRARCNIPFFFPSFFDEQRRLRPRQRHRVVSPLPPPLYETDIDPKGFFYPLHHSCRGHPPREWGSIVHKTPPSSSPYPSGGGGDEGRERGGGSGVHYPPPLPRTFTVALPTPPPPPPPLPPHPKRVTGIVHSIIHPSSYPYHHRLLLLLLLLGAAWPNDDPKRIRPTERGRARTRDHIILLPPPRLQPAKGGGGG